MGPKVEAVCRFVEFTGDMAAIGKLADAREDHGGKAGTIVTPSGQYDASAADHVREQPLRAAAN